MTKQYKTERDARLGELVRREGKSDRFTVRDSVSKHSKKRLVHALRTLDVDELNRVCDPGEDVRDMDEIYPDEAQLG
jgi:hypothetical protein